MTGGATCRRRWWNSSPRWGWNGIPVGQFEGLMTQVQSMFARSRRGPVSLDCGDRRGLESSRPQAIRRWGRGRPTWRARAVHVTPISGSVRSPGWSTGPAGSRLVTLGVDRGHHAGLARDGGPRRPGRQPRARVGADGGTAEQGRLRGNLGDAAAWHQPGCGDGSDRAHDGARRVLDVSRCSWGRDLGALAGDILTGTEGFSAADQR